jgi:hypothetical protein
MFLWPIPIPLPKVPTGLFLSLKVILMEFNPKGRYYETIYYKLNLKARVFASVSHFHPHLEFEGKAWILP